MLDDARLLACLVTAFLTLCGAGLARLAGMPRLGGAALPLALLLGFTVIIGGLQASPRQLAERMPMLALLLAGPALVSARWQTPWLGWTMLGAGALLTGWWMSGGAFQGPDLSRALPVLLAVAIAAAADGMALRPPWHGAVLPAGLALLLFAAAPPGPWAEIGLVLAAAGLAGLGFGPRLPMPGWLALGPAMAGLAAGPIIALGRPQDWTVALTLLAAAALGAAPLPPLLRLTLPGGVLLAVAAALWLW